MRITIAIPEHSNLGRVVHGGAIVGQLVRSNSEGQRVRRRQGRTYAGSPFYVCIPRRRKTLQRQSAVKELGSPLARRDRLRGAWVPGGHNARHRSRIVDAGMGLPGITRSLNDYQRHAVSIARAAAGRWH